MSESSPRWPTLDALARELSRAINFSDEAESALEERVIALEEVLVARWPRRVLLRRRLARSLRASAAAHAYAGSTFRKRRLEAAFMELPDRRRDAS